MNIIENPDDPRNIYNLGLIFLRKGDYVNAIHEFKKALKIDHSPKMSSLLYPNLGQAYALSGNLNKAIDYFERALKFKLTKSVTAFIYANLGYIYTQKNNHGIAILLYRSALEFKNEDLNTLCSLANIYESKLQYSLATSVSDRILEINPEYEPIRGIVTTINKTKILHKAPKKMDKFIKSLGLVVVPHYYYQQNVYHPMIIYVYPESPLFGKINGGEIITDVLSDNGRDIPEEKKSNLEKLLEGEAGSDLRFSLEGRQVQTTRTTEIDRPLPVSEQLRIYTSWLQTFDKRLLFLWKSNFPYKKEIGTIWGHEFEGLVTGFESFSNNPVYHFAYALMIEHLQPLAIFDKNKQTGMDYEIDLSKNPFTQPDKSVLQILRDHKFNETADFLSKLLA